MARPRVKNHSYELPHQHNSQSLTATNLAFRFCSSLPQTSQQHSAERQDRRVARANQERSNELLSRGKDSIRPRFKL